VTAPRQPAASVPWLADLLHAWQDLAPDREAGLEIMRLLGFDAGLPEPAVGEARTGDAPPVVQPHVAPVLAEPPTAAPPATPADEAPAAATDRVYSRCTVHPLSTPQLPPWLANQAALALAPARLREPAPLFPMPRARSVLVELVAHRVNDGAPDVPALLAYVARGELPRRLPRLPRRTLAFGAELVLDSSAAMQPFQRDAEALEATLKRLLPEGRLRVTRVRGAPPREAKATLPLSTVLAVTDLGCGHRPSSERVRPPAAWLDYADRLAAQERRLRALVPLSALRAPLPPRRLPVVQWSESTTLGDVKNLVRGRPARVHPLGATERDTRRRQAGELTTLAAPARRIDTALLRALRQQLLPGVPPQAEADVWFGTAVASRGPSGITLTADAAQAGVQALAGQPERLAQALALIEKQQADQPESVRIEEHLQRLALRPPLDVAAVEATLRPVYKALASGGPAAQAAAAWVPQAWRRMPAVVRDSHPARQLALAATVHLGSTAWADGLDHATPGDGTAMPWLLPEGKAVDEPWMIEMRESAHGIATVRFTRNELMSHAVHRVMLPGGDAAWLGLVERRPSLPATVRWVRVEEGLELAEERARGADEEAGFELLTMDGRRIEVRADLQAVLVPLVTDDEGRTGLALTDDLVVMPPNGATRSVDVRPFRGQNGESLGTGVVVGALALATEPGDEAPVYRFASGALRPIDLRPVRGWGHAATTRVVALSGNKAELRDGKTLLHHNDFRIDEERGVWAVNALYKTGEVTVVGTLDLASLRQQAIDLKRKQWQCRVFTGNEAGEVARGVRDILQRILSPERVNGAFADVLVIVGAQPPDGLAPATGPDALPVLWAPMWDESVARSALESWPPDWRAFMATAVTLKSALERKADPYKVAEEIVAWHDATDTTAPAPVAPAPPPKPPVTSGVAALRILAERLDARTQPGVYALNPEHIDYPNNGSLAPVSAIPPYVTTALVLVPGTMADTAGSFSKLWSDHPELVRRLFSHYNGHVYALQHRTLTETPLAAAALLAQALPAGCRIHMLTHDSGGFVAEALALAAACDGEFSTEQAQALGPDDTARLSAAVRGKRLAVQRVVRVACPMRGSVLLASGRTEKFLKVMNWAVKLATLGTQSEALELLHAMASNRDGLRSLPGIAALSPQSPLIEWLHAAQPIPGQLRVIAGAVAADSVASWLRSLTADAFFGTDNDMVVTTRAMYGGVPRQGGGTGEGNGEASFLLVRGQAVSHFNYFSDAFTANAICEALIAEHHAAFKPIGPLSWNGSDASGLR